VVTSGQGQLLIVDEVLTFTTFDGIALVR